MTDRDADRLLDRIAARADEECYNAADRLLSEKTGKDIDMLTGVDVGRKLYDSCDAADIWHMGAMWGLGEMRELIRKHTTIS